MEQLFEFSGITAVTICSMGLALLIEIALLKLIFRCLANVKVEAVEEGATVANGSRWAARTKRVADFHKSEL